MVVSARNSALLLIFALTACSRSPHQEQPQENAKAPADEARVGAEVGTDAAREWAYGRKSPVGPLDKALDAAPARHWEVVDMKNDWKVIYPFELPPKATR